MPETVSNEGTVSTYGTAGSVGSVGSVSNQSSISSSELASAQGNSPVAEGWKDRLHSEAQELETRIEKIAAFLSAGSPGANPDHQMLLHQQHDAMIAYLEALKARIGLG
jgi:hypothetical protein